MGCNRGVVRRDLQTIRCRFRSPPRSPERYRYVSSRFSFAPSSQSTKRGPAGGAPHKREWHPPTGSHTVTRSTDASVPAPACRKFHPLTVWRVAIPCLASETTTCDVTAVQNVLSRTATEKLGSGHLFPTPDTKSQAVNKLAARWIGAWRAFMMLRSAKGTCGPFCAINSHATRFPSRFSNLAA